MPGDRALAHLADLDAALFAALARRRVPVVGATLQPLSRAADHAALWVVVAGALAAAGGREGRRGAVRGLGSLAGGSAVANLIGKTAFRRARPALDGIPLERLARRPRTTAMPSGHAASAAGFAVGAASELPAALAVPVLALAGAVSCSRVYVGAHYPGDVLAGAAMGAAVALAGRRLWATPTGGPPRPRPDRVAAPACPLGAGLTVVVNPRAGGPLDRRIPAALRRRLPDAQVLESRSGQDLRALLHDAARDAVALGVSGGDGTANVAAQVAIASGLPLLAVPGGTLNHLADDLGLTGVEDCAEAIEDGRAVRADLGLVAGQPFVNSASFGAYADLVALRRRLRRRIGKWPSLAVATLRALANGPPPTVRLDGREVRPWLVFVGNGRYTPAALPPVRRARLDDGLLDVRVLDAATPRGRLGALAALLTGSLARCAAYRRWAVSELHVESLDGPLRLARDGELCDPAQAFTIATQARALTLYGGD